MRRYLFIFLVSLSFFLSSAVQSALVTNLDIEVNGVELTATFNSFSSSQSFNSLWDANKNNNFFDDGSADLFDFIPTFWNDLAGAKIARDKLMTALGSGDWVNKYGTISDVFIIPVYSSDTWLWNVKDGQTNLFTDVPQELNGLRNTFQGPRVAWVTFEERVQEAPSPGILSLMALGLASLRCARRHKQSLPVGLD